MFEKREINLAVLVFMVTLLMFGGIMFVSYATDTYATIGNLNKTAYSMITRNGRPVIAAFFLVCNILGITGKNFLICSNIVALIMVGASIYVFSLILKEYIAEDFIVMILSVVTIANLYIIEYFMFMEKGAMMLGIFLAVLGTYFEHEHLKKKSSKIVDKYTIYILGCIFLATFTYQTASTMYIVLSIPFIYHYSATISKYIEKLFRVFVIFGITYLANALFLKCTVSSRMKMGLNIKYPLKGLIETTIRTFNIIPAGIYAAVLVIAIILNVFDIFGTTKDKKKSIVGFVSLVAISNLLPIISIFLSSGWYTPRVVYPLGSFAGILFVNYLINGDTVFVTMKRKYMIASLIGIFLVFQYFGFSHIYEDKYVLNSLDEYRIYQIGDIINEYEKNTGNKVTQIAIYRDAKPYSRQQYFENLYDGGDLIVSSFTEKWSDVNAINYYLGKKYVKADITNKMKDYFHAKNWNHFSKEQLYFNQNVLHLCVY